MYSRLESGNLTNTVQQLGSGAR